MKALLALDTATNILSIALSAGEQHWYRELDAGLTHSEVLMNLVDDLFKEAALQPQDLEAVACMKGPGSFTGLRIGFAAAKGMALALDIPLLACPTLDCIAYAWEPVSPLGEPWPGLVVPVLDARRQRFYAALYAGGKRISEEMDLDAAALAQHIRTAAKAPIILTGVDAPLFLSRLEGPAIPGLYLDPLYRKGRGIELLAVAKKRLIVNNDKQSDVMSGPEYIRKSDAEL
ncbi:MAG: tRNA (adenosine(37)-N6)-threonylcarbamoyltransferase complex dimerization subunit type 1 TsaB [Treponema sp.]|jgi:tRNA threonylcarbamoyladenosine biosynthesis protein TsaB|nr:tRNA (adenosine(37)-N6)-threonylcarbamoyltransferase complex dimerization subunit type 1 TsaB [Treponema sp.]